MVLMVDLGSVDLVDAKELEEREALDERPGRRSLRSDERGKDIAAELLAIML